MSAYIKYERNKCELGDSKFFGSPDLPENFEWPVDEDGYDMDFVCQINCEKASQYADELPKKGMLYFFGCFSSLYGCDDAPKIEAGFQSMGNFAVKYSDVDTELLQSGEIVDENGESVGFKELKITFTENEDDCTDAMHQLCGDFPENSDELDGYKLLFCLDSFDGDDFSFEFENSGYLYYIMKNDDFEKAMCYLSV